MDVQSGGTVVNTTVNGGALLVEGGGTATDTVVNSGGSLGVFAGMASGIFAATGSRLGVQGGTVSGVVLQSGVELAVYGGSTVNGLALYAGASADFADIPYSPDAVAALDLARNVLVINSSGKLYTVKLNGSYAGNSFGLESDFGALNSGRGPAGTRISITAAGIGATDGAGPLRIIDQNNITNAGYGTVITNAGPNTVVLGSGPVTVQSNGADTILGGTGQDGVILAGSGAVVVGGTGAIPSRAARAAAPSSQARAG